MAVGNDNTPPPTNKRDSAINEGTEKILAQLNKIEALRIVYKKVLATTTYPNKSKKKGLFSL